MSLPSFQWPASELASEVTPSCRQPSAGRTWQFQCLSVTTVASLCFHCRSALPGDTCLHLPSQRGHLVGQRAAGAERNRLRKRKKLASGIQTTSVRTVSISMPAKNKRNMHEAAWLRNGKRLARAQRERNGKRLSSIRVDVALKAQHDRIGVGEHQVDKNLRWLDRRWTTSQRFGSVSVGWLGLLTTTDNEGEVVDDRHVRLVEDRREVGFCTKSIGGHSAATWEEQGAGAGGRTGQCHADGVRKALRQKMAACHEQRQQRESTRLRRTRKIRRQRLAMKRQARYTVLL